MNEVVKKETRVLRFLELLKISPKDCFLKYKGKMVDVKENYYYIESETLPKEKIEKINEKLKRI